MILNLLIAWKIIGVAWLGFSFLLPPWFDRKQLWFQVVETAMIVPWIVLRIVVRSLWGLVR